MRRTQSRLTAEKSLGECPFPGCGAKGAQLCRIPSGPYKGEALKVLIHPGRGEA